MNEKQWEAFLSKDKHTKKELIYAENESCNWTTCAVGCQLQKIFKVSQKQLDKMPYDLVKGSLTDEAHYLGGEFAVAIPEHMKEARKIWSQIRRLTDDNELVTRSNIL